MPGIGPRPRERLVARVRQEPVAVRARAKCGSIVGQVVDVRAAATARRVRQERVGQQDHRRPVADGDAGGLDRGREAVATARTPRRSAAATRRAGRTSPAAGRLLRLRRQPVDGTAALHVDDHHRQLHDHGEAERLGLQVHAGAARAGHRELAGERRAERHVRRGDLVLGLQRHHAEVLVPRELVQQLGGRRDRVARVEQRQPAPRADAAISPHDEGRRRRRCCGTCRARPARPRPCTSARTARWSRRSCSRP